MKSYYKDLYPFVSMGKNSIITSRPFKKFDVCAGCRIYLGRGLISVDKKEFWINLPKNASNSMSKYLFDKGWRDSNYIINPVGAATIKKHVILRDPVERWRKCVTEICAIDRPTSNLRKWFLSRKWEFTNFDVFYDLHLVRQADHIIDLDWNNIKFYYCDELLSSKVLHEFNDVGIFPLKNVGKDDNFKKMIQPWVDELLTDVVLERIRNFYQLDYELINKVILIPPIVVTDEIVASKETTTDTDTDTSCE